MGNKKFFQIIILIIALFAVFFIYNQISNNTSGVKQSITGTIESLKLGKELRADGKPGIQIDIQLKPNNQENPLQLIANSDTFYIKYFIENNGNKIEKQFRIAELKTGDKIEVFLEDDISSNKISKLIQYVQ